MNKLPEGYRMLQTGQYGRLYITNGSHARGDVFHVYVLPHGAAAKYAGDLNPPAGIDSVKVYGEVGEDYRHDATFGWIHEGPWQEDLRRLAEAALKAKAEADLRATLRLAQLAAEARQRDLDLLATYPGVQA